MKRGLRRAKTAAVVKNRVRKAQASLIFSLDKQRIKQPHRTHKAKPKFTSQRGTLKPWKKIENRAFRKRAKLDIIAGREPSEKHTSDVRYNYW